MPGGRERYKREQDKKRKEEARLIEASLPKCQICSKVIQTNQILIRAPCQHTFHRNHFVEKIGQYKRPECPVCKKRCFYCGICNETSEKIFEAVKLTCGHLIHATHVAEGMTNIQCPICGLNSELGSALPVKEQPPIIPMEIDILPVSSHFDHPPRNCGVCKEEIKEDEARLECGHSFHREHLLERFAALGRQSCPICLFDSNFCGVCNHGINKEMRRIQFACGHYAHIVHFSERLTNCPICNEPVDRNTMKYIEPEKFDPCVLCDNPIRLIEERIDSTCPCGHWLHGDCAKSWYEKNNFCPKCKGNILTECFLCKQRDINPYIYGAEYGCCCLAHFHVPCLTKWLKENNGNCPSCGNYYPQFCFLCSTMFKGSERRVLHCGHPFHDLCLATYLQNSMKQCPVCNKPITEEGIPQIGGGSDGKYVPSGFLEAIYWKDSHCSFCGNSVNNAEITQMPCCGQSVHNNCLEEEDLRNCPQCKKDVTKADILSASLHLVDLKENANGSKWMFRPQRADCGNIRCDVCGEYIGDIGGVKLPCCQKLIDGFCFRYSFTHGKCVFCSQMVDSHLLDDIERSYKLTIESLCVACGIHLGGHLNMVIGCCKKQRIHPRCNKYRRSNCSECGVKVAVTCIICYNSITIKSDQCGFPCQSRFFHNVCVANWFDRGKTDCPSCFKNCDASYNYAKMRLLDKLTDYDYDFVFPAKFNSNSHQAMPGNIRFRNLDGAWLFVFLDEKQDKILLQEDICLGIGCKGRGDLIIDLITEYSTFSFEFNSLEDCRIIMVNIELIQHYFLDQVICRRLKRCFVCDFFITSVKMVCRMGHRVCTDCMKINGNIQSASRIYCTDCLALFKIKEVKESIMKNLTVEPLTALKSPIMSMHNYAGASHSLESSEKKSEDDCGPICGRCNLFIFTKEEVGNNAIDLYEYYGHVRTKCCGDFHRKCYYNWINQPECQKFNDDHCPFCFREYVSDNCPCHSEDTPICPKCGELIAKDDFEIL